jgi:hypothetical protein
MTDNYFRGEAPTQEHSSPKPRASHTARSSCIGMQMRPLLIKFLVWHEQCDANKPLELRPGGIVRALLAAVLLGKREFNRARAQGNRRLLGSQIKIRLQGKAVKNGAMFATEEGERRFEKAIYELHRELFLRHVLTATSAGMSEADAIRQWMRMLRITERESWQDTQYSALKKISTRSRMVDPRGVIFVRGRKRKAPAVCQAVQGVLFND